MPLQTTSRGRLFTDQRHEIHRETPEFVAFDHLGMVQPDDERAKLAFKKPWKR